jgi:hypothetical protein
MRTRFGSDMRQLAIPLARSYIRYAPFSLVLQRDFPTER